MDGVAHIAMSYIKNCPTCNKPVSSDAESCPHCGHRLKAKEQSAVGILAAVILGLIGGWIVISMFR